MRREDDGLPFMLRYENVAWYEPGVVRILDRRVYPGKTEFAVCTDYREVARAITDMVTQSAGPYAAVPMGMALAAWACRGRPEAAQREFLREAARTLAHARPTTRERMALLCRRCLETAEAALRSEGDVSGTLAAFALELNNERYARVARVASHLVPLFPAGGTVMTYCFAETIVGMMLRECRAKNREIRLYCPETRPYFQGARLTATCCRDMGFDVTVITDAMAAFVMRREGVDVFTTAADAICGDGHVVNKVGTLETAICAKYFGVPYFVTGAPDLAHPTVDTVTIELRDGSFTLQAMGTRTAVEGVRGLYPAFDITPPHLVSGVVTDLGVYTPYDLPRYFDDGGARDQVIV